MKVEAHFLIHDNDTSAINNAKSKAVKNFSSFFGGERDYGGYAFSRVEGDIWSLRGDAMFVFKILSILSEQDDGLEGILAVDIYKDDLAFLAFRQKDEYKFRFKTPYFISTFDKETGDATRHNEGPFSLISAKEFVVIYENEEGDYGADQEDAELIKGVPSFKKSL